MEFDKKIIIDNAVKKSEDAINAAEYNFKNKFYTTCQNRLYYAIFYIVTALAYTDNFITSKHSQLMSWFNKKYIYTDKIFDEQMFKIYKEAFTNRQKSDYDFMYIVNENDLCSSIKDVKTFVKNIKDYLQKNN